MLLHRPNSSIRLCYGFSYGIDNCALIIAFLVVHGFCAHFFQLTYSNIGAK
jgi:hypothetical protein